VGTAGFVAAAIVVKEKRIVAAFQRAGATSPSAAVAPGAIGVAQRVAFRKLCQHAALREVGSGKFYLDEPSWRASCALRRRVALISLFGILIGLIAGIVIGLQTR